MLEQSGTAKCLPGQVLLNWLTAAADGHGGISSITPVGTSGLVDTYRITLADTTTYDFAVTNGRGIKSWDKTGTSGLVDTYTMTLDDGTEITYTVKNGEKGDKGDNVYTWIKYASQEPTEESHSMGDIPDDWRGEYNGPLAEAPTDWKQYKWYKIKGEHGNTGAPATLVSTEIVYQSSDSGTIIPSGTWGTSVPVVGQGKYLWTRSTITYNTGSPVVSYSVSRMGIDGSGAVSSVCNVSPASDGNVALTAANVGAMPTTGGDFTGPVSMNGQTLSGLNAPTAADEAATKAYADKMLPKTGGTMTGPIAMGGNKVTSLGTPTAGTDAAHKTYVDNAASKASTPYNLLDNSDFTNLVAKAGIGGNHGTVAYAADRWILDSGTVAYESGVGLTLDGTITQKLENAPTAAYPYVGMVSGTASISYADGAVTITSSGGVIQWAALYETEYTAETMPEYQPKGYAAELAECQRYYWKSSETNYIRAILGIMTSTTKARFTIPLPTKMRTAPTVSMNFNNFSIYPGGLQISNIGEVVLDGTFVLLGLTTSGGTTNAICILRCVGAIELSADL